MKRIYLSGPISGLPLAVARSRFYAACKFLRIVYPDAEIYNPMTFNSFSPEKKWQDYMHVCLPILETCDTVILLPGWSDSNGAQCERYYAQGLSIPILVYDPLSAGSPLTPL